MKTAIMALSGGMDSTSLLLRLLNEGHQVYCISYEYGQKHRVELERAQQLVGYLLQKGLNINYQVIKLDGLENLLNSNPSTIL